MNSACIVKFEDIQALKQAFLPFIKNGGLFIATDNLLPLGTSFEGNVKLPNHEELLSIKGPVVWVNPKSAKNNVKVGIAIQLDSASNKKITDHIRT